MRLWLVDDKSASGSGSSLETVLRQLEERPGSGLRLLGTSPFQPDFPEAMRKLVPDLLDMVVVNERMWPDGTCTQDILNLGLGLLVVTSSERAERFRALAEEHPIAFVAPSPSLEAMWLALVGAFTGQRRQLQWRNQVDRLQRRLSDRIIIERAKGILMKQQGLSEEASFRLIQRQAMDRRKSMKEIACGELSSVLAAERRS